MDEDQEEEKAPIEEQRGGTEISVASGLVDDLDETVELPGELPVLPLKETVAFPNTMTPLAVGQERSVRLVDDVVDELGRRLAGYARRELRAIKTPPQEPTDSPDVP